MSDKVTELREAAIRFEGYQNGEISRMLREAANTIESLCDSLQAATLDDDDYERKMDALLCRLTNGKFSKSRAYDLDFMESCVNEEFEMLYANELNAELGSGTCSIIASSTDGLCSDHPRQWFKLSCGHSFTLDGLGTPMACAVCGKAVER